MTVKKILQKSHNLGTVNVAERLTKEDLYDTWSKLGAVFTCPKTHFTCPGQSLMSNPEMSRVFLRHFVLFC
jgi:membrane peptidoglycan carboxypeptidase